MALTSPRAATISAGLGIGGSSDVEEDGRIFGQAYRPDRLMGTPRLTIFDPSDFRVCLVGAGLSARPLLQPVHRGRHRSSSFSFGVQLGSPSFFSMLRSAGS